MSQHTLSVAAARKAARSSARTRLEDLLVARIAQAGLQAPVREFQFSPPRRWRFDLCWPHLMLAVEIEGGIWVRGRHSRGTGMLADMAKYNAATLAGWSVLRVAANHIADGSALEWIEEATREAA